jgi:hypothetical protein
MPSTPRITVRPTEPIDLPALGVLFAEGFGRQLSAAEWEWKYRRLPGEGRSMVAVTAAGELLAHAGALALPARWPGGEGPAWQLCDFVGRRAGLRAPLVSVGHALLADLPRRGDLPWAFGFPSPRHLTLGERTFGYHRLPWIRPWEGDLASAAAPGLELAVSDRPDQAVEASWLRCGGRGVRRSPAFLAWRYTARPDRYYRFYSLGAGGCEGLVVAAPVGELAMLAEVWLPSPPAARAALRAVAADLVALGMRRWRSWPLPGEPTAPDLLAELGLRPCAEEVPLGCRPRPGEDPAPVVAAATGLYYPMGDHDLV